MNNYMKLLFHLKQFEGDGKFHSVEQLFPGLTTREMGNFLKELVDAQFIQLTGHEPKYDSFVIEKNILTGETKWTESPLNKLNRLQEPEEYKAKITFAGAKYLKEEIQMQESGKYNISVSGSGTNNTFVIESNNVTIENKPNFTAKIEEIINALKSDESISAELRDKAIADLRQASIEVNETGKLSETLLKGILKYGAQIGSIGSLLYNLFAN